MSDNLTAQDRCGFIALIGAPNAGKSTLLNRLVGAKISIVSPKVQTTRRRLLGIAMQDRAQLIFIDTPGIFSPKRRLDRSMVAAAWSGTEEADQIVLLVDASLRGINDETRQIINGLKKAGRKAILAINKVDAVKRDKLLALTADLNALGDFTDTFMISAETGDGVDDLMKVLVSRLPVGPHHFPDDELTDMPLRLLAAEVTREHLFRQLHDEAEGWEDFNDGSVKISHVIFIARDSQKSIVLGKGGARIKAVRSAAQKDIEEMLQRKVHLFLFVKVREDWQEDPERYREMGIDFEP
jgi:GTP-binding protein Era